MILPKKAHRIIGTPDYIAPEILNNESCDSKSVDWWSMGVILYELLVGIPPFNDETVEKIYDNVRDMRMEWPPIGDGDDCISKDAADLIKKLLEPDPKKRIGTEGGAAEVKKHPFFNGVNFDKIKVMDPPFIPGSDEGQNDLQTMTMSIQDVFDDKDEDSPLKRKVSKLKSQEIEDFNMKRIDILHDMNQELLTNMSKNASDF